MAETKRIELTTVGTLKKDRKPKDSAPTYRFVLTLGESNDKTCPEYSYSQLLKSVLGENKNGTAPAGQNAEADPFGDDDDDEKLKALARKFEEKYAPQNERPGRKVGRLEDYIDLGMGYDETDPFIDNTDAYDELVPSTLTTQYGGFYINSGKLDFKEVQSDSSEDDFQDPTKKRRRKRLKDFDKDLTVRKKKKFVKDRREDHIPKKRGRKPLDRSDGKKQPTVALLLQHHKAQQQQLHQSQQQQQNQSSMVSTTSQQAQVQQLQSQLLASQTPQQAMALASELALAAGLGTGASSVKKDHFVKDIVESVILDSRKKDSNGADFQITSSSDSENLPFPMIDAEGAPKLPDGIPDNLEETIKLIKIAALKSVEGKCKFFTNEVNGMLLKIEMMARELSCSQRSMVYTHLASHLPCTKETLQKRAKKLRLHQEDGKLREPMHRLKRAIDEAMPSIRETHKARCQTATEAGLKVVELSAPGEDTLEQGESDETDDVSSPDEEKKEGGVKVIRKKFVWSDRIRKLLCDVVLLKMKCYEVSKSRTQSANEYLRQFLIFQVLPLWPKGWMRSKKLKKESRVVHAHLTYRPKKNLIVKKFLPAVSLLPLKTTAVVPTIDPIVETSLLKAGPKATSPAPMTTSASVVTSGGAIPEHAAERTPPSSVLPQVYITPVSTAAAREPELPSITVTPIGTQATGIKAATAASPHGGSAALPPATLPSDGASSFQSTKGGRMSCSPILDSPTKAANNRANFTLFNASAVSAITTSGGDSMSGIFAGGLSSAKDLLGEIINRSLANYPNSEIPKFPLANPKYRDGNNFSGTVVASVASGGSSHKTAVASSSPDIGGESSSKPGFTVPKKMQQALALKSEMRGGASVVVTSTHKDAERRSTQDRHASAGSVPHDLRTPPRLPLHAASIAGNASASSHRADRYLGECLPLSNKLTATVPFHSLYDIQSAIERGLQGGHVTTTTSPVAVTVTASASSSSPAMSPSSAIGKVKSRVLTNPQSASYYSASSAADQPLNFSTPRQSSVVVSTAALAAADRAASVAHLSNRNTTPPKTSLSPQEHSRGSSPQSVAAAAAVAATSVRLVNLPSQSSKYVNSTTSGSSRVSTQPSDKVYLEGIAASWQKYHMKKARLVDPLTSRPSKIHSDNSSSAHVLPNHTLPKVVPSSYSDSIHSTSQGCADLRLHRPRLNRPPTTSTTTVTTSTPPSSAATSILQGNNNNNNNNNSSSFP